jgi:hypothetical protein
LKQYISTMLRLPSRDQDDPSFNSFSFKELFLPSGKPNPAHLSVTRVSKDIVNLDSFAEDVIASTSMEHPFRVKVSGCVSPPEGATDQFASLTMLHTLVHQHATVFESSPSASAHISGSWCTIKTSNRDDLIRTRHATMQTAEGALPVTHRSHFDLANVLNRLGTRKKQFRVIFNFYGTKTMGFSDKNNENAKQSFPVDHAMVVIMGPQASGIASRMEHWVAGGLDSVAVLYDVWFDESKGQTLEKLVRALAPAAGSPTPVPPPFPFNDILPPRVTGAAIGASNPYEDWADADDSTLGRAVQEAAGWPSLAAGRATMEAAGWNNLVAGRATQEVDGWSSLVAARATQEAAGWALSDSLGCSGSCPTYVAWM